MKTPMKYAWFYYSTLKQIQQKITFEKIRNENLTPISL